MNTHLPNLYDAFALDRSESSEALGISLSARDLRLEQMGIAQSDPRRTQTVQAFAVLADPAKRATYDAKIDSGVALTWAQIQHLGNFGTVPDAQPFASPEPPQQPQQTQQQPWNNGQTYTYGNPGNPANPTADYTNQYNYNPLHGQAGFNQAFSNQPMPTYNSAMSPMAQQRPTASTRLWMAFLDMIIAGIAGSAIAGIFSFGSEFLATIILILFAIVYIVGSETMWGSTPAKKIMGYETRDVNTHARLSAGASLKRNWWKFFGVTGVATFVSFIMAAIYGSSINEANEMRGTHDRLANAEVVKKNA